MTEIKDVSQDINSEICDAEHYIRQALVYKDRDKELADLYYRLSGEELDHMGRLHTQVTRLIDAAKRSGEAIPPGMPELYEYLHKMHVDASAKVVAMQAMYRGK